ncbi:helix-turn-helix transcriptional regulator [Vibrio parahaemolyticus]|nr:helix-turn-helix transcriptional regulator [Vibrio parahaemolyticus]EGQ8182982.1 helix-turn-helix transcriptional regulator [Vibrio parahaemolyticus]EGQ8544791.1 hypothetical protein [Vibrio parahaemolyticus]EKQ5821999.1 helix-turn-helix transcriptional regulator [Vibrio parahaemolyticus]
MYDPDDFIHMIYESACQGDFRNMLHEMTAPLDSNKAFISLVDKTNHQMPLYQMSVGAHEPNMKYDLEWLVTKHSSSIESDPLYWPCQRQREGRVFDSSLIEDKKLVMNDYFNEVYVPADARHVLGVNLINNSRYYGMLAFNRSNDQQAYDKSNFEFLEGWVPHLKRALLLQLQFGAHKKSVQHCQAILNQSSYALVLLNQKGNTVYLNAKFEALCQRFPLIQCCNGKLYSSHLKLNSQLQLALRNAVKILTLSSISSTPKTIFVPPFKQYPALIIEVSPFISNDPPNFSTPFKGILVAIKTTETSNAKRAQQIYHLSQAETRLVSALMKGFSLSDIAEQQYVAISTVRSHLKSVLKKTETHSQTQLVLLIGQLSGF